ncbi:dihydroneopterin aldolase / 2-amino-4-hydroxy-6-hydroxymethyldihydropteridine diphosphokinase [Paraoerskovia marina]|uniref:Bifunctional folate synthesis protein n=1 Tax=Paraoerskovia marina TaxID=545619 RepID=A0A1H1PXL6_9CELL|nr:dihydroneopterin aldolase / 2-amino-4-hydroxy-6-hydroxymethyldihydropteridine diphosphokinase [Paraoerskovia marina]
MSQFPGGLLGPDGFPLDTIRLVGIRATGYHGVLDHEKRDGQEFGVDVTLHVDTRAAAAGDELSATTSYADVAADVVDIVTGPSADLIETVAERIAATVLTNPGVHGVDVTVHKPEAPIPVPFDDAAVSIRRDRVVRRPAVAPVPIGGSAEESALENLPPAPVVVGHVRLPDDGAAAAVPAAAPVPAPPTEVPAAPVPTGAIPAGAVPAEAVAAEPAPAEPAYVVDAPSFEPTAAAVPLAVDEGDVHTVGEGEAPVEPDDAGTGPVAVDEVIAPTEPEPEPEPAVPAAPTGDVMDVVPEKFVDVVLALGSNVGDSKQSLRDAVTDLDRIQGLELREVAPLARTEAVGGPDQDDYLNTVVIARTTLSPRSLLHECQAVETAHGRERAERWGPRTLDVDIVSYGSIVDETRDLTLPHPRARERAFVLEPWAQIDPDAVLLGLGGGPVAALAGTAPDAGGIRWMALDWLTDAPMSGPQETVAPAEVQEAPAPAQAPTPAPAPAVAPPADPAPVHDERPAPAEQPVPVAAASTAPPTPAPWAPPESFQPVGYGRPAERDVERPDFPARPQPVGPRPVDSQGLPAQVTGQQPNVPSTPESWTPSAPQRRRVLGPPDDTTS